MKMKMNLNLNFNRAQGEYFEAHELDRYVPDLAGRIISAYRKVRSGNPRQVSDSEVMALAGLVPVIHTIPPIIWSQLIALAIQESEECETCTNYITMLFAAKTLIDSDIDEDLEEPEPESEVN